MMLVTWPVATSLNPSTAITLKDDEISIDLA